MKKLILFGGAFDPIHLGHINMAKNASEWLDSDVLFIPARISVWKDVSLPKEHKMKIVELAIKDNPRFHLSDYEINSEKEINYTIDTVKHFKETYPDSELYLLIGADQVNLFHKWKDASEISKLVQIVYFKRPGFELETNNIQQYHMVNIPGEEIEISSTDIKAFKSLELPYEVIRYIEDNNLYYMNKIASFFDNEKRYKHCLSVANLAYNIAVANNLHNPGDAYIAGLLHDTGKAVVGEEALTIMKQFYKEYLSLGAWSYHQFIGEYIAKNSFGIVDESILKAIKYHATGSNNMDVLGKIIYASDKIDPLRGFDSSDLIDAMVEDAENGFVVVLKANKEYLETHNKSIENELTYKCFKEYLE